MALAIKSLLLYRVFGLADRIALSVTAGFMLLSMLRYARSGVLYNLGSRLQASNSPAVGMRH
jgi:hypothetical protein